MTSHDSNLGSDQAQNLARRLEAIEANNNSTTRVVFAESCTAGLVAALLGQVPGISRFLCGSMVTYRESAKQQWLSVSAETLESFTAESIETTESMATNALRCTKEADFSAAVTGHLGPLAEADSQNENDGKIFIAVAKREDESTSIVSTETVRLQSTSRIDRQSESAAAVLQTLCEALNS